MYVYNQCVMCFSVLLLRVCDVWLCWLNVFLCGFDVGVHLDKKKSWVSCVGFWQVAFE
jgi:hypothetical protein